MREKHRPKRPVLFFHADLFSGGEDEGRKAGSRKTDPGKAAGRKTIKQKDAGTSEDASKRILDIIRDGKLSAGQINIIVQAIQNDFTTDELEYLYSLTMDSEQMTREYERIRKEKADGKG